jgi:hypothetical protein
VEAKGWQAFYATLLMERSEFGLNELLDLWPFSPATQFATAKQALRSHDVEDKHGLSIEAVEHAAGWLHDLTIAGTLKLLWSASTFRVVRQLLHMREDTLDKLCRRSGVLQCDVVTNCIQIAQSRL